MRKLTYLHVQEFVESKGGILLSKEYKGCCEKIEVQCEKGHIWTPRFNDLKKDHWCSVCSRRKKHDIEDARGLAKKYQGECLSQVYTNSQSKLEWKCKYDHIFSSKYNDIDQGHWCFICGKEKQKETSFKKYGTFHPMQADTVKDKLKNTMMEKYGVDNPSKNTEIRLRAAKTANKIIELKHWFSNEEIYCQASYEVSVVEYLNKNKIDYLWQPQTFVMPNDKTYTPDCYIVEKDLWIEIKGYFRKDAKEKWDWFHTTYLNSELWDQKQLKNMEIL